MGKARAGEDTERTEEADGDGLVGKKETEERLDGIYEEECDEMEEGAGRHRGSRGGKSPMGRGQLRRGTGVRERKGRREIGDLR